MKKILLVCLALSAVHGDDVEAFRGKWNPVAAPQQPAAEAVAYERANAANDLAGVAGALENGSAGYNAVEQARVLREGLESATDVGAVATALGNAGLNAAQGIVQDVARLIDRVNALEAEVRDLKAKFDDVLGGALNFHNRRRGH